MNLNRREIEKAIDENADLWGFGNSVLYGMCDRHPWHNDVAVVVAKAWLIGRSYSVQVERKRTKENNERLDEFYRDRIAGEVIASGIDAHIRRLRSVDDLNDSSVHDVLRAHGSLLETVRRATADDKRSFCSKYLHFHAPSVVPIFDSLAVKSLSTWNQRQRFNGGQERGYDPEYARFVFKLLALRNLIEEQYQVRLTPRQLDRLLLGYGGSLQGRPHRANEVGIAGV